MAALTDLQRRTLGNLPRWRDSDELLTIVDVDEEGAERTRQMSYADHVRETNRYPEDWEPTFAIRTSDLAERLTKDAYTTHDDGSGVITAEVAEGVLTGLQDLGLAKLTGDGWTMTSEGFDALNAEVEE